MKALVCPSIHRDEGLAVTNSVKKVLQDVGIETVLCPICNDAFITSFSDGFSDISDELPSADFIIALGGDGTILKTARVAVDYGTPIIAVNLGDVGFMADLSREEVYQLAFLASGTYKMENRMMLDVKLFNGNDCILSDIALNEVVVKGVTKIISVDVSEGNNLISRFSGDGVVIATPTGSTAYSMAAGGPIVEPDAKNIIITPICSHVLSAKSFVMAPYRKIHVCLTDKKKNPAFLSIDGGKSIPLSDGCELEVKLSEKTTNLIRISGKSFYSKVLEKLGEKV